MVRKVIPVDPSNWRLQDPGEGPSPLTQSNLPINTMDALLRAAPGTDPHPTPDEMQNYALQDDERRRGTTQIVKQALKGLPPDHVEVVLLIYAQGMSLREVERYTGIPKTTVARRRDAGKQLLADALGWELPTPQD